MNLSIVLDDILKEGRNCCFKSVALTFHHLVSGFALPFANCAKCAEKINVAQELGHWRNLFAKKKVN